MTLDFTHDRSRILAFLTGCWALYLLATPFQIFPSGYPQPADILMLVPIFIAGCLYLSQPFLRINPAFILLALFAALTCFINLVWFAFYREKIFFLSSLFYIYNACIFASIVFIFQRDNDRAKKWTTCALALSVFLELIWIVTHDPLRSGRALGSFGNPNQMAYWALTTLLCLAVLRQNDKFNWLDGFALLGCGAVIALSLSKAGMLAFLIAVLIIGLSPRFTKKSRFYFWATIVVFCLVMLTPLASHIPMLDHALIRLHTIGADPDDTLVARGYTRLLTHPQYMMFGAGEGAFSRFVPYGTALEIHSGFANLLFCYGILGLGLFVAFLLRVFRESPWHVWMLLAPIVFHSLTHQTFRFTTFWVFLALVYAMTAQRTRASIPS